MWITKEHFTLLTDLYCQPLKKDKLRTKWLVPKCQSAIYNLMSSFGARMLGKDPLKAQVQLCVEELKIATSSTSGLVRQVMGDTLDIFETFCAESSRQENTSGIIYPIQIQLTSSR